MELYFLKENQKKQIFIIMEKLKDDMIINMINRKDKIFMNRNIYRLDHWLK